MHLVLAICGIVLLLPGLVAAQESPAESTVERVRTYRNRHMVAQPATPATGSPSQENEHGNVGAVQHQDQQVAPQAPAAPQAPVGTVFGPPAPEPNLPPPTPPQVTYRDGLLTVRAFNSTLGGVLAAIRSKAGIQFEGLEPAPERIAISMGPAPEGEVLAAILSGSRFDYVAIDRQDSPGIVQRVILTPHSGGTSPDVVAGAQPERRPAEDDEEAVEEADSDLQTPPGPPAHTPLMEAQPIPAHPNPQPGDSVTKSPEQLLEELKQMQQRQLQRQQPVPPQKAPQ